MRFRRGRFASLLVLVALVACGCAPAGTPTASATTSHTATPLPPSTTPPASGARSASLAWSQYDPKGAIQIWVAAQDGSPRLLAAIATTSSSCPIVSAGPPMLSPDSQHLLVALGEQCSGLIDDPGPLAVIDTTSGQMRYVPLPSGATVLPQVRSYGWVDNSTIFAIPYAAYNTDIFVYSLGATGATTIAGLHAPLEGVVRNGTLFYLGAGPSAVAIQSVLYRYDLSAHRALPGGINLGAYSSCSECPSMIISPGWDVSPDGNHVVYQFTTPQASGGITSSRIFYASADGSGATPIAQYLATNAMVHLRLSPDGTRVAITAATPSPTVITACVRSPGTKDDPCFRIYTPDAMSVAAWAPDGRSFIAATLDASYGQPTSSTGALIRYTVGTTAGRVLVSGAYDPWSNP